MAWCGSKPEVYAKVRAWTEAFEQQAKLRLQKVANEFLEIERREGLKIIAAHSDWLRS